MNALFHRFATWVSDRAGSPYAFLAALAVVAIWAISGPFFGFSDTWLLLINTVTTIVTFLMVFLIQHKQGADTQETKTLIRELVRAVPEADSDVIRSARDEGGTDA